MAINFSHSAAQLIGQYYNFVRYGFDGYKAIHERTHKVALYLAKAIEETGLFEIVNDGSQLPIVCYKLKEDPTREWTLYLLIKKKPEGKLFSQASFVWTSELVDLNTGLIDCFR